MRKFVRLGATGNFPEGKIDQTDEGELMLAVSYDAANDLVRIDFGKSVKWLALPPELTTQLANLLLKAARRS